MLGTQLLQHARKYAHQINVKHAQHLIGRGSRVGERPQNIKHSFHAQGFAHGRHMAHAAVVVGRKHKAHAGFFDALPHFFRREAERHAHLLHHIGRAAG